MKQERCNVTTLTTIIFLETQNKKNITISPRNLHIKELEVAIIKSQLRNILWRYPKSFFCDILQTSSALPPVPSNASLKV